MWQIQLKHFFYLNMMRFFTLFPAGNNYQLFAGQGSSRELGLHIARRGYRKVLVVTDKPLADLGIVDQATAGLREGGAELAVFDGVLPDPDYAVVESGLAVYRRENCDCIMALGGGSSIDAAKIIAMAVDNHEPLADYVGFNKVKETPVPLFVIATTSGTGSEATSGAVITDSSTHEKKVIADPKLLPLAAALDPNLLTGLPPHITAATGMDALTHAIEAYIGVLDPGDCQEKATAAIRIIFDKLAQACNDGSDAATRDALAHASYMAGQAINQVNVGNVHAIAHQIGASYGTPHGLANAQVLPHVLEMSLPEARSRLAELAQLIGRQTAEDFIAAVRELSQQIGIAPTNERIKAEDIPQLTSRAVEEGLTYPCPHLMLPQECSAILQRLAP